MHLHSYVCCAMWSAVQVAERAGVHSTAVKNVIIWGNHSSTQVCTRLLPLWLGDRGILKWVCQDVPHFGPSRRLVLAKHAVVAHWLLFPVIQLMCAVHVLLYLLQYLDMNHGTVNINLTLSLSLIRLCVFVCLCCCCCCCLSCCSTLT
jgi:hypothetical protein